MSTEQIFLLGDSWLASTVNSAAAPAIQSITSIPTVNLAIAGSASAALLSELQTFVASNGFPAGSTAIISIGGNDLLGGVAHTDIINNINAIVALLEAHAVRVIISGSPDVHGPSQNVPNQQPFTLSSIYAAVQSAHPNVMILDYMSKLLAVSYLQDMTTGVHLNSNGWTIFNIALANAYQTITGRPLLVLSDDQAIDFITRTKITAYGVDIISSMLNLNAGNLVRYSTSGPITPWH
jgi:hypothetical protein